MLLNSVDKYLENGKIDSSGNVNTSTSSGKSTLLWEKEVEAGNGNGMNEETIQLENIDKYKYLLLSIHMLNNEMEWIPIEQMSSSELMPIDIIKGNRDLSYGPSQYFMLRYIAENNFKITYFLDDSIPVKIQVYGVE